MPSADTMRNVVADPGRLSALARTGLLDTGPEDSFERLASLARRLVDAPVALVSLVDVDRQYFKCCLGLPDPYGTTGETPLSHSICQYALAGPEPLVINDTASDERLAGNLAVSDLEAGAYLGIPLVDRQGHVLGSFCVLDHRARVWTDDETQIMVDLAASVMAEIELRELALERDQTAALLANNEARLRSILDGLFIFVGMLTPDGTVVEANSTVLDAAGLTLAEVAGRPLWETFWWSWDPDVQDRLKVAVQQAAAGQTSRYDTVVRAAGGRLITIDFQLVPILDDDGTVGGMVPSGLDISQRKRFEDDLANLAGAEAAQRHQAENLLELAQAMSAALDVDDIAKQVAAIGGRVVGAAFSNIALRSDDGNELELRHGASLDPAIGERWPRIPIDDRTPLGFCALRGEPCYLGSVTDIVERFPIGAADSAAAGFQALAAVPVGRAAAVGFAWTEETDFTPSLVNALGIVAQLTSQALERARLYEQERRVADRLQRSLLPQNLVEIPGASVAARYESAVDGLRVGGDWYDIGTFSGSRWVLAVGDVVGSDLAAAAAMGQLRSAFGALATNADDVDLLVERLDLAAHDIPDAKHSTMVGVEYDSINGRLRMVSAGHPPVVVRRRDGTVDRLEGTGPPLGIHFAEEREVVTTSLESGECALLYTDGLIERRGESIDVGLSRLEAVLSALDDVTSADAVCEAVYERLGAGAGDDIALLAISILAAEPQESGGLVV